MLLQLDGCWKWRGQQIKAHHDVYYIPQKEANQKP